MLLLPPGSYASHAANPAVKMDRPISALNLVLKFFIVHFSVGSSLVGLPLTLTLGASMAIQQSVAQQNAKTTAEVRHTAELFAARPKTLAWVGVLIESRGLRVSSGILVRMFETPEQDGNLVGGVWLTSALEFWEFKAVVSRVNGELFYVERFENITSSVTVNKHVPGTGKSFGYIAIEVLSEVAGA